MDAWDLHEARLIQEIAVTSGANALSVYSALVPAGKVWSILGAACFPSVTETRTFWFAISGRSLTLFAITRPQSFAFTTAVNQQIPCLTEGMEIKLFPGERIYAFRDVATAGSTISLVCRYVESDLPFYAYKEPQKEITRAKLRHGSVYRSSGGISPSGGGGISGGGHPPGGGGGGSEPV